MCVNTVVLNMLRSRSNRILQFRTGSRLNWISKKLYRIRYEYPICVDHCSQMFNHRFFRISTGLDQILVQYYRIRIGLDYTIKILDWDCKNLRSVQHYNTASHPVLAICASFQASSSIDISSGLIITAHTSAYLFCPSSSYI